MFVLQQWLIDQSFPKVRHLVIIVQFFRCIYTSVQAKEVMFVINMFCNRHQTSLTLFVLLYCITKSKKELLLETQEQSLLETGGW